jgi:protocatechuate 4,5-dioxygenase alpha chain
MHKLCHDLKTESNRQSFRADPSAHLQRYTLSEEERSAILEADYGRLFDMGLNIYLLVVLSGLRGVSLTQLGEVMRAGAPVPPFYA